MLIDARADLNVRNGPGATPLFLATECSHDKCALALIEAGADPNLGLHAGARFSPDNPKDLGMHGDKPLHVAVYNNPQFWLLCPNLRRGVAQPKHRWHQRRVRPNASR